MQILKINKKTSNKVEQYKKVVHVYCVLNDIELSNSELEVMSYYIVYGINDNSRSLILNSMIVKSEGVLKNITSHLKKEGLLGKDYRNTRNGKYFVIDKLKFDNEALVGIIIKLDNSSNEKY